MDHLFGCNSHVWPIEKLFSHAKYAKVISVEQFGPSGPTAATLSDIRPRFAEKFERELTTETDIVAEMAKSSMRGGMTGRRWIIACAASSLLATGSMAADRAAFLQSIQAGQSALKAKHYKQADLAFRAGLRAAPQQPRVAYMLAQAAYGRGDTQSVLSWLRRYVAMGVHGPHDLDADFPTLRIVPQFVALEKSFAEVAAPLCRCEEIFTGTPAPFIAEGIVVDDRRLLISGVYARKIIAIADGRETDFVSKLPDGLSPFGMALDHKRGLLWVAAASLAPSHGATAKQRGRSSLLAFHLRTGSLLASYSAPRDREYDFGDLGLAPDGTVYVTDSRGHLFRAKPGARTLEPFGDARSLASPQGIRIRVDNRYALLADYGLGLLRIDLATGAILPIRVPDAVTTLGIDGVALLDDGSFVATQNGLQPMRIVHFRLSPDWLRVTGFKIVAHAAPQISDLSLIASDGSGAVVVGVSQWASFGETSDKPERPVPSWRLIRVNAF